MNAGANRYEGACHCRAIGFVYRTALLPKDWPVRACQCTFCLAHGALSTSDPRGDLEFLVTIPGQLQRYRFGLKTADFLLCRQCGVYIGAEINTAAGRFGIINSRALQDRKLALAVATPMSYDTEESADRVLRREQRWTPLRSRPG